MLANTRVTLNWVFTLRENEAPFNFFAKWQPLALVVGIMCVAVAVSVFNKEQTWSRSLRNFPKFNPTTWCLWLEQGGKKCWREEL